MEILFSFSLLCLIGDLCLCHVSSFHFHLPAISFSAGSCSLLAGEIVHWGKGRCSSGHHWDPPDFSPLDFLNTLTLWAKIFHENRFQESSLILFLFPFPHNSFGIFLIFFGVLMYLLLLPHFIMILSDLRLFFPIYPSFCPLYPHISWTRALGFSHDTKIQR